MRRGENRSSRRKTSRSRVENQQTQPTYDAGSGIEPGTHWWKASALTTTPTLLPYYYLQKQAEQAVTNSNHRAHTTPLFSKLKILHIFQINVLDIARFKLRYRNNLLPPLFFNLFMTNSQVRRYDTSRTAGNYRVHSCRTNIKKFTILYQGPRVWNCLPASITNLSSFPTFMNKVLKFLLK